MPGANPQKNKVPAGTIVSADRALAIARAAAACLIRRGLLDAVDDKERYRRVQGPKLQP